MGIFGNLKEFYLSLEEKYYSVLDAVDEKIPVYKVITPIDGIIPSFAIFLIAFLAILLLAANSFILPLLVQNTGALSVTVNDASGTTIAGADVIFETEGRIVKETLSDSKGIASAENIPKKAAIKVAVKKEGYISAEKEFELTEIPLQEETIALTSESAGYTSKTIRLVDSSAMSPPGEFTLSFTCPDNDNATPPNSIDLDSSDRGEATVNVPNDCGRLIVSVKDTVNFQEITSKEVTSGDFTIELSEIEAKKGRLRVQVKDEGGINLLDGIKVILYKYNDLLDDPYAGPVEYSYTSNGYAEFSMPAGNYVVRTYDNSGKYGDSEYEDEQGNNAIRIVEDETKNITILVGEEAIGSVKIKVIGKENKEIIDKAIVKLEYGETNEPLETLTTDSSKDNGIVSFTITRDTDYTATVSAKGYTAKKVFKLRKSDGEYEIELTKCTPGRCGQLLVKVIDQDGFAVEGASVALYDYHTKSLASLDLKATDINGIVKFRDASSGSYYAYAFKGANTAASTCNEPKDCYYDSLKSDDNTEDITVVMAIPNGIVKISVFDEDRKPLPNPRIMVFDARTNKAIMETYADSNGTYSFETKADKKIFARVLTDAAPEKANYTTTIKEVEPLGITEFTVITEPSIINKEIEAEFLGLYSNGKRAITVAPNQEYTAKFRLRVPEGENYSSAGLHVRTGDEIIMEKDKLFIKAVNVPKASIIKAAYYDEGSGKESDDYEVTESDAKWFNANWNRPILSGVHELEAAIKIKASASIGEKTPIHYRAYAENDGKTERYPLDAEVTNALYAKTKTEWLEVGSMMLCDNEFCFAASIEDLNEGIIEPNADNYLAKPFNDYKLGFTLINNSDVVHNVADLRISNPDKSLFLTDYWITAAGGIEKRGSADGYELPRLDLGNFRRNDDITGHTLKFMPQKAGSASIQLTIVSDKRPVWSKTIMITVGAPKAFDISVRPDYFNIGMENDINILVLDKEKGLEVEGAIVKLLDKHDYVLQTTATRKDGTADLVIPASSPGTRYKIRAEKTDYDAKTIEIEVNNELLKFNPKNIGVSLNAKTKQESDELVTAANVAGFPVKITSAKLKGDFKNLLDLGRTNAALESSYVNYTIEGSGRLEMHLKTFLSAEGKLVTEPISLEGSLLVGVENFGRKWSYEVPVRITIGLGGEVDDPGCLVMTRKEWIGVSEGQPIVIEFEIQNNCTIAGKPVDLKELEGKLEWKSNQLGRYTLKIGESEVELRGNYYKIIFHQLPKDGRYTATLKFTPFGGVSGTAEADISLRAANVLEAKKQFLEAKLSSKISIENATSCIIFDKEYVEIIGAPADFTVKVDGKCALPYDLKLESKLKLGSDEFTINPGASKTVQIIPEDNYPGQYPVYVRARMQNEVSFKHIETIKAVIIKEGCIALNRYEFDLYDSPKDEFDGYDTSQLLNNCVEKDVKVKVNMKDWGKAAKDGLGWGAITALVSWIGGSELFGPKTGRVFGAVGSGIDAAGSGLGMLGSAAMELFNKKPDGETAAKQPDPQITELKKQFSELETRNVALKEQLETANKEEDAKIKEEIEQNEKNFKQLGEEIKRRQAEQCNMSCAEGFTCIDGECKKQSESTNKTTECNMSCIEGFTCIDGECKENPIAETAAPKSPSTPLGLVEAAGNGFFGGMFGKSGLFGFGTAMLNTFLGKGTALEQGGKMFLASTFAEYYGQDTEEFTVKQRNVEIKNEDIKLLAGEGGGKEALEKDIKLAIGEIKKEPSPKNPDLIIEKRELKFTNDTKFTTSELEPKYSILKVTGIKHNYANKTYSKDDVPIDESGGILGMLTSENIETDKVKLDEIEADKLEQKFQLEFNAVPPEIPREEDRKLLDCQAGMRTGTTGIAAFTGEKAPLRIKYNWSWSDIAENECDEGNDGFIYCDGVQFSIEVLRKIETIRRFLETNGSNLKCPSQLGTIENTSQIGSYDIGVASIKKEPAGAGKVRITAGIKNTNPSKVEASVRIYVVAEGTTTPIECPNGAQRVSVVSEENAKCDFALGNGSYTAFAEATPVSLCENCEDKTEGNRLSVGFKVGETGLAECEPYETARLKDFLAASGIEDNEVLDAVSFKAHLIKERYSPDLLKDFDSYARTRSFFDAPRTYTNDTDGLGKYFKNPKIFVFKPKYGEANPEGYALPGPGIYNATINIKYKDSSWELFKNSEPNAAIEVLLDKTGVPEPDSPLYYLPFDGLIGTDSERTGYGVNFEGDVINIDNGNTPLKTITISSSTPIDEGIVNVTSSRDFKRINVDEKGVVLKVERGARPQIIYSPSFATPVMLKIENKNEDAFAYYSVEVDGSAKDVGYSMANWYGIGINCRSFSDTLVYDEFWGRSDTHALPQENRKCSLVEPEKSATSYGFEFCNPSKFGDLYLETVLYTPYQSNSLIKKESASDTMSFIGSSGENTNLMVLGGVGDIEYGYLNSIQGIINLVKEGAVCVGTSDARAEFFWNPKAILEAESFREMQDESGVLQKCIKDE